MSALTNYIDSFYSLTICKPSQEKSWVHWPLSWKWATSVGEADQVSALLKPHQLHPPPPIASSLRCNCSMVQPHYLTTDLCRNTKLTRTLYMPVFGLTSPGLCQNECGYPLYTFSYNKIPGSWNYAETPDFTISATELELSGPCACICAQTSQIFNTVITCENSKCLITGTSVRVHQFR